MGGRFLLQEAGEGERPEIGGSLGLSFQLGVGTLRNGKASALPPAALGQGAGRQRLAVCFGGLNSHMLFS